MQHYCANVHNNYDNQLSFFWISYFVHARVCIFYVVLYNMNTIILSAYVHNLAESVDRPTSIVRLVSYKFLVFM